MKPRPRRTLRSIHVYSCLLAALTLFATACNNDQETNEPKEKLVPRKVIQKTETAPLFSQEDFISSLSKAIPPVDTLDSVFVKRGVTLRNARAYTYLINGHRPIWVTPEGVTEAAGQLIGELDSLKQDGLDPERYHYTAIRQLFDKLKQGKPALNEVVSFDTACTGGYLRASRDLLMGMVSPKTADDQWFHANDSVWQAPQLLVNSFFKEARYPSLNQYRSTIPTYRILQQELEHYEALAKDDGLKAIKAQVTGPATATAHAGEIIRKEVPWLETVAGDTLNEQQQLIRGFQNFYGLAPTGKIDSNMAQLLARQPDTTIGYIKANLERLRWLPKDMEKQYVLVNIPLMELLYRKDGTDAFKMRVVVGRPSRQTPALNAVMANVVFSPPWGVPPTILKKEVIPGVAKRGGSYLTRKGLRAYDRHGKQVNVSSINANNIRGLSFRQPPGARNALGEVKFNLPNKWDIYLHDTPHKEDFPRRYRAKSSGCIRVEHPKDFAEFILKDLEGRNFTRDIIDSIINTRHTRYETLKTKIPVHLVYLTAFEDTTGQHMRFLPDIYKRDDKLIMALSR